jgi:hypothetical protein
VSRATTASTDRRLYRLAPVDKTGVFLSLSLVQLLVAGSGALAGSVVMVVASVPIGLAIAVGVGGIGLARLSGEPLLAQLPMLVRHTTNGRSSRNHLPPLPLLGPVEHPKKTPALWRQDIHTIDPSEYGVDLAGPVAVVVDRTAGLYAATLRIAGRQFGLLEPDEQDYQLANWGKVLQGFVTERPTITSVRWCEWAAPSGIEEQRDWLDTHKADQPIPDALASYERLLAEAGPIATRHEVLLTISTHTNRATLQKRHHRNRRAATLEVLLTETRQLQQRLTAAGLTAKVLDPAEQTRAMRLRLDPTGRSALERRQRSLGNDAGATTITNALPLATASTWTTYTVDSSLHRAFWVSEWPRLDVPGDWLRPLLLHSTAVRSIGVFFTPVPRSKSQRHITAQATKIEADVAHRNEKGYRVGAWHRRAAQAIKEREEEIVAGYTELAFTAIVNVTAPDIDELDRSCADLVQIAAAAGIELRALHGRHADALAAVLPCARSVVSSIR